MAFKPPFTGIHAIAFALFDAQERLDRAAMKRQTEICLGLGVHGMAALGLATEVSKLSLAERRTVIDWVAEDVAGKVPLAFTMFGGSVAEQVEQVKAAEAAKADWVILQPPMVGSFGAAEYIRFFGRIAEATSLPVAIQNAPAYMGRGLSSEDIRELVRQHPNICLIKGEGPATDIQQLISVTEGRLPVMNGRGGLELADNLRAGCVGLLLAPDTIDYALRAYNRFLAGDAEGAEEAYREVLPAIVFIMQSIESLLCYGKRIFGARAGIEIHDRSPAQRPSAFGLELVKRYAEQLGPYAA
ncbi:MAG: dihydrodipicolinate synthase family protein [Bosea sp.]|jgi:4-hydroxy-tetrahydrodipicolinate synthase|uniref:dihydrodipicolinate synthase family protein n=1 Tax=Bosea sp. (in: a-proteobacteria) TaxID=1871050 RepID=UPI001ACBE94A|nr:dihydrodipicolinate synthase family protein [Bosea sp. (in: a-proteobacteria)]MBN9467217.1 dihydrodipicolinate synthase family protein [Bosea sp. (in: a-proteobacteria)]